jgi:hypothetical protein
MGSRFQDAWWASGSLGDSSKVINNLEESRASGDGAVAVGAGQAGGAWRRRGGRGAGEQGRGDAREGGGNEDVPLMKESIDFFDFWDWVPDRERIPETDEGVMVP